MLLTLCLSAACLLDRCCKTLPKTQFIPANQVTSQLQDINGYPGPRAQNPQQLRCTVSILLPKFHSLYQSRALKIHPHNFPQNASHPTPSLPYLSFTDSPPPFTPYLTHLLPLSFPVNDFIFSRFIGYPLLYTQPFYIIYH